MNTKKKNYRWNATTYAAAYDAAAAEIHPCYAQVQKQVGDAMPWPASQSIHIVDLGGGSGRLLERLLGRYPNSNATLVDPSEAFLGLAKSRLANYGPRVAYAQLRAQDAWDRVCGPVDVIVSTSALHHLEAEEKNAVFERCRRALAPGGLLINGDEYRPPSDTRYRELLEEWGDHMGSQLAVGAIPESFAEMIEKWRRRNLDDFGGPRQSGDDCHETIEEQTARLYGAGFSEVTTTWHDRLWAVIVAAR